MFRMLVTIGVLAAPIAIAQTGPAPSPRDEIAALYARMDEALGRKDPDFFLSLLAPNAALIDDDGARRTAAETREGLGRVLAQISSITVHTDPAMLIDSGDRAWATTKQVVHFQARQAAGGQPVTVTVTNVNVDSWQRQAAGWRIVEERTLMVSKALDRPASPVAGGPDTSGWTNAQKLQYTNQLACQSRMIAAMGWQRQGYLAVMPSC